MKKRSALRLVDTRTLDRGQWLAVRQGGIGSSDAAAAVGLSPYKSQLELWLEKTGRRKPPAWMIRVTGVRYSNPTWRRPYQQKTWRKVQRVNAVLQHRNEQSCRRHGYACVDDRRRGLVDRWTFRLRQLTTTTMGAETAMLRTFATWLQPDTVLVSYNGKCYDSTLLKRRYRLARFPDLLSGLGHLDLLHPVHRHWKGVWENCRLATAERELLGVVREDDLPGSEAPGTWLSYPRGGLR